MHEHLSRSWIADKIHSFKSWLMEAFFTPVVVTKCEHEWSLKGMKVYRMGKKKFTTTKHKCKLCGVVKMTNFKY